MQTGLRGNTGNTAALVGRKLSGLHRPDGRSEGVDSENPPGAHVPAMTSAVKDELSRLSVTKPCCRRAEMSVLLRFAGGLHRANGRVVVEAELDTGSVARRLRKEVAEVYGFAVEVRVLQAGGLRR